MKEKVFYVISAMAILFFVSIDFFVHEQKYESIFNSHEPVFYLYEPIFDSNIVDLVPNFEENYVNTLGWIVNYDIIYVQGIPLLYVVYKDSKGVITELTYILDERQGIFFIGYVQGRQKLDDSFIQEMISISDERMYNLFGIENFRSIPESLPQRGDADMITVQLNEIENSETLSDVNNNTYLRYFQERLAFGTDFISLEVWLYHNLDVNLSFIGLVNSDLSTKNGGIRATSQFGNTEYIILHEQITRHGTTLNFSFPWSIGANTVDDIQIWSSGDLRNVTSVVRHRPAFSGSWLGTIFGRDLVTITSGAEVVTRVGSGVHIFSVFNRLVFSTR